MNEFKQRGIRKVEKDTLIAAVQIVSQMEVDQALLHLVLPGKSGWDLTPTVKLK